MTSQQIENMQEPQCRHSNVFLKEIALQLAIANEQSEKRREDIKNMTELAKKVLFKLGLNE